MMKTVLYFKATENQASRIKFAGASRAAHDLGFRLQSVDATENRRNNIPKLIAFWNPVGVIIDSALAETQRPIRLPARLPAVYVSLRPSRPGTIFSVCGDGYEIVQAAARELLSLDYPDYGFVGYPKRLPWSIMRGRIFHDLITLHGKRMHTFEETDGRGKIFRNRRLQNWLSALPKPCGIFAANDVTANGILDLCSAAHIRVPSEIAVVGVDDDEAICLNTHPPLSSVLPDLERVGYMAMKLLDEILRNPRLKPECRNAGGVLAISRRASSRASQTFPPSIAKAISLIRGKACDGLRARDVIAALKGSRRHVESLFREAIGHSILDEIQSVRMERARELLHHSRHSVSDIANLSGYASVSSFCKQYRKAFGTSPRQTAHRP